jgi:hypothetical protein
MGELEEADEGEDGETRLKRARLEGVVSAPAQPPYKQATQTTTGHFGCLGGCRRLMAETAAGEAATTGRERLRRERPRRQPLVALVLLGEPPKLKMFNDNVPFSNFGINTNSYRLF